MVEKVFVGSLEGVKILGQQGAWPEVFYDGFGHFVAGIAVYGSWTMATYENILSCMTANRSFLDMHLP
jgi:hypothetical protein